MRRSLGGRGEAQMVPVTREAPGGPGWPVAALAFTLALLVTLVAVLLANPRPAAMHGALRRSVPAAGARLAESPRELRLEFTEPTELTTTHVTLTDEGGRRLAVGSPAHAPDSSRIVLVPVSASLAAGTYTVAWQVTGRDGHPVRGTYAFTVVLGPTSPNATAAALPTDTLGATMRGGVTPRPQDSAATLGARDRSAAPAIANGRRQPAAPPAVNAFDAESGAYVALRWASYVALLLAIGAVVIARTLGRATTSGTRHLVHGRLAAIGLAAAWIGIALAFARLVAQSWAVHGADRAFSPTLVGPMVGSSNWGHAWSLQLAAAMIGVFGFTLALHDSRRLRGWKLAELAALLAAVATAMGGHAASAEGWRLPLLVGTDAVHVLAAGAWVGGVAMLALGVLPRAAAPETANIVRAFSPWALGGVMVLALTGLLAAWMHLDDPWAPWASRYGRVLLIKLALVALMMAFGALNWRRLGPASQTPAGKSRLAAAVRVELLIALAVVAATAVLVAISPDAG